MKGLDRYIRANAQRAMNDIDFHSFIGMMEEGMSQPEIARELGVSEKVVEWLAKEMEKDV
ncbi:MAG: hypothetical protein HPY66_3255 [Firmicutes bacterium]|nr:hypothetical protein [Bacillota bacterium]MDI6706219.1 hypothetical protein [Bacillota bacterium]